MASVSDIRHKQRAVIEFLMAEKETVGNIHKRLCKVYGTSASIRSNDNISPLQLVRLDSHGRPSRPLQILELCSTPSDAANRRAQRPTVLLSTAKHQILYKIGRICCGNVRFVERNLCAYSIIKFLCR